jgi:hypothetical protein
MKHKLEKALKIGIGGVILGFSALIFIVVFGSSFVALMTVLLGVPLAFPMTTTLVVCCLIALLVFQKK